MAEMARDNREQAESAAASAENASDAMVDDSGDDDWCDQSFESDGQPSGDIRAEAGGSDGSGDAPDDEGDASDEWTEQSLETEGKRTGEIREQAQSGFSDTGVEEPEQEQWKRGLE